MLILLIRIDLIINPLKEILAKAMLLILLYQCFFFSTERLIK